MKSESTDADGTGSPTQANITASELLAQCQELHKSVQLFQSEAAAQYTPVKLGSYTKSLAAELRTLERLALAETKAEDSATEESSWHALRSSNLSFLQTVWDIARRCRNVVAMSRRESGESGTIRKGTMIDVVAEMGLLWVKVVTVGERKLLFEMAKEGWDVGMWEDSEEDGEADDNNTNGHKDENSDEGEAVLPLVSMVNSLVTCSRTTKLQYRHPEVLIWFPNLEEDKIETPAVSKVLESLRATGATIHCGTGEIKLRTLSPLQMSVTDGFQTMLPLTQPSLTSVINLDCTILLALISDLSHLNLDETDAYNKSLQKQLATERSRPLLSQILYPALAGRQLIASTLAVKRMQEIVDTLGTPGEKIRADIVMKQGIFAVTPDTQLRSYLSEESVHDVPRSILLPIQVVDTNQEIQNKPLPSQATLLDIVLSDINKSVFWLGWCKNVTTITSNKAVTRQIEGIISDAPGETAGPQICLIDISRSLVGKERVHRG